MLNLDRKQGDEAMAQNTVYKIVDLKKRGLYKKLKSINVSGVEVILHGVLDGKKFENFLNEFYSKGWLFHSIVEYDRQTWSLPNSSSIELKTTGTPLRALFIKLKHFPHTPFRGDF